MTFSQQTQQKLFLPDLSRRWGKNPDQVLALALTQQLPLWIEFNEVFLLQQAPQTSSKKKVKKPVNVFHNQVKVQPLPEVLNLLQGRCDRILIDAQLACLDENGAQVMVSNSVGEEWGETSMIGLQPARLFARLEDVIRIERQESITPAPTVANEDKAVQDQPDSASTEAFNPSTHPHHALELHIAMQCWQALYQLSGVETVKKSKASTMQWVREHYPTLTAAAAERIATVVSPSPR